MRSTLTRAFDCPSTWRRTAASAAPVRGPTIALVQALRGFFVRFQATPNESCYKFYVDNIRFLPAGAHTMMFDRANDHQSPIAQTILSALPMVEEVTVGQAFVTVKRVETARAAEAARYFAMRFHGVTVGPPNDSEQAAAVHSQDSPPCESDAVQEGEGGAGQRTPAPSSTPPRAPGEEPYFREGGPEVFEMGGFTVTPSSPEDEALDEAAIAQLIEAMDWSELKLHVSALLTDHLHSGAPHVSPDAPHPHADTLPAPEDSEVVLMIKELLATTVRPQLQDDGGDIRFVRFVAETGAMEVELLGACRTCKSGHTTLVDLIERTTRHWIPEVAAVVEVGRRASASEPFAATGSGGGDRAAGATGAPSGAAAGDADDDDAEEDLTKTAGHGAPHRRVVVDRSTSARVVREVHGGTDDGGTAAAAVVGGG